jgi:transcriptional regulator with XRE-family HTH domain
MKRTKDAAPTDPIAQRIRARRKELGLSLRELAKRAGLASASHVFHLENGQKAPSEKVAGRLAEALGEDPELLRAWALARNRADLATAMAAASTLAGLLGHEPRTEQRPEPNDTEGLVRVPVIPEGAEPAGPGQRETGAIEVLRLDPRLFPNLAGVIRPFAYRLSAHGARRLPDLRPGDCVVISRSREEPVDDAAYAVRLGPRIELARLRIQDGVLHLLEATHARDSERLVSPDDRDPSALIVGKVVVAIRRWL